MGAPEDSRKRKLWIKRISIALKGRPLSEKSKKNKSKAMKGKSPWNKGKTGVYSIACLKQKSESQKGKSRPGSGVYGVKNPSWKGGITSLTKSIRHSAIYNLWRKAVFTRDKWQCQDCGNIGGILRAHHLYRFSKLLEDYKIVSFGQAVRIEELWDICNGITLCVKCHKRRHKNENYS